MDLDDVFGICYRTGCALQCTKRFVVPSVGCTTGFDKFTAEIFPNKISAAELCQILRIVSIELVVNSIHLMGIRVTMSYRYCIAFEMMLLFLVHYFYLHSNLQTTLVLSGTNSLNSATITPIQTFYYYQFSIFFVSCGNSITNNPPSKTYLFS